jgi:hypothetical protein
MDDIENISSNLNGFLASFSHAVAPFDCGGQAGSFGAVLAYDQ